MEERASFCFCGDVFVVVSLCLVLLFAFILLLIFCLFLYLFFCILAGYPLERNTSTECPFCINIVYESIIFCSSVCLFVFVVVLGFVFVWFCAFVCSCCFCCLLCFCYCCLFFSFCSISILASCIYFSIECLFCIDIV